MSVKSTYLIIAKNQKYIHIYQKKRRNLFDLSKYLRKFEDSYLLTPKTSRKMEKKLKNPFKGIINFLSYKRKSYLIEQAIEHITEATDGKKQEKIKNVLKSIIPQIKAFRHTHKLDNDLVVTHYLSLELPTKSKIELSRHYFSMLKAQYNGLEEDHNFKQYCFYIYAQIEGILNALFSDEDFEKTLFNVGRMPAYMKEQVQSTNYITKHKEFFEAVHLRYGDITMAEYLLNGRNDLEDGNFVPLSELSSSEKFQIFLYVFKYKFRLNPVDKHEWEQIITDFYLLRQVRDEIVHPNSSRKYPQEDQEKLHYAYNNKADFARKFKTLLNKVITWFEEFYPLPKDISNLEHRYAQSQTPSEYYY